MYNICYGKTHNFNEYLMHNYKNYTLDPEIL